MKKISIITTLLLASTTVFSFDFTSVIKTVQDVTKQEASTTNTQIKESKALSNSTINSGLKEALKVGVNYGVNELSKKDGYLKNKSVKILLPQDLAKVEGLIRKAGGDKIVDNFILSMNNAATQAAPKTVDIFINAIDKMTLDDAQKVLTGGDDAATQYFKNSTTKSLQKIIKPILLESMQSNNVVSYYDKVNDFYKSNVKELIDNNEIINMAKGFGADSYIPSGSSENLNEYVTQKTIDGLFIMIAKKESEIRKEPLAQTTSILKQVFGSLGN